MLLAGTDNTPAKEIEYMRLFENYPVDGIILVGTMITAEHRRFLKESKVPVVVIGQHTKYANCIYHDDYGAGEAMDVRLRQRAGKRLHISEYQEKIKQLEWPEKMDSGKV